MPALGATPDSVPRARRLVDEVVAHLRDSIIDGALPAGMPLPQTELAGALGVSRTPLREALRVLEREGLLCASAASGTVEVVALTSAELVDMFQVREVIDGLAARLAATRPIEPADHAEADRLLKAMQESTESTEPYDPVRRSRAHSEFHELVIRLSRNNRLHGFLPLVRTSSAALYLPENRRLATSAGTSADYRAVLDDSHAQHHAILRAIVAGDPDVAEAAARAHILRTLTWTHRFGTDQPEAGCDTPA